MVPVVLIFVKLPVVALTVAAWIVFVTLKFARPLKFVIVAFVELNVFALIVPVAVIVLIFARLLIVLAAP